MLTLPVGLQPLLAHLLLIYLFEGRDALGVSEQGSESLIQYRENLKRSEKKTIRSLNTYPELPKHQMTQFVIWVEACRNQMGASLLM